MTEPPEQRGSAELNALLVEAWRHLMELVLDQRFRWAEVAGELGITQAGLRGLLAIDPGKPPTMRELARALNCDPSYITAVVDDLERAQLAERRPSPVDRRVKTVELTTEGVTALGVARDGLLRPPPELARLLPAEQEQLAALLRRALG